MAKLNAAIKFDGKWFVAPCLDLPVTSQDATLEANRPYSRGTAQTAVDPSRNQRISFPRISLYPPGLATDSCGTSRLARC